MKKLMLQKFYNKYLTEKLSAENKKLQEVIDHEIGNIFAKPTFQDRDVSLADEKIRQFMASNNIERNISRSIDLSRNNKMPRTPNRIQLENIKNRPNLTMRF